MTPFPYSRSLSHLLEYADAAAGMDMARAASPEVASTYGVGAHVMDGTVLTMASGIDVLAFNRVLGWGMDSPAAMAQLDEILRRYRDAGVRRLFLQISPAAQPLALHEWLRERAIMPYNRWMKLYRRADSYPELPDELDDIHIDTVTTRTATTFGHIVASAFGMPEATEAWVACLAERAGWYTYLASEEGTPIGAASMYVIGEYAWLGIAGTLAYARRRGVQSALIRHRVNAAHAMGCRWIVVETAEDTPEHPAPSFHNLRRLGFTIAYPRVNYVATLV